MSFAATRVRVEAVALRRGRRRLVDGLSFTLEPGEGLAIHGPNGSGKSTLLRALAGLHEPDDGSICVEASDTREDPASLIAYLGHLDAVKAGQSAGGQLAFWAALSGQPASAAVDAASRMGLSGQLGLPGAVLSAGQRRRLALCRLLIGQRPIWLLDEPAAPLDGEGRALLGALLDAHRADGGIIVAAVHDTLPGSPARRLDLRAPAVNSADTGEWM